MMRSAALAVACFVVAVVETGAAAPDPSLAPGGYPNAAALRAELDRIAGAHPKSVRLGLLAKSIGGREVVLATLGRPEADGPRPAVLVVANAEGDQLIGSTIALRMIDALATADGQDEAVTKLLDRVRIHVVPRLDVDGAERLFAAPAAAVRGNDRPLDRDRDGRRAEDGPDDLNGDGLILTMRAKDKTASWVADEKDPRILRRADPIKGETAVYSEQPEGRDDDGDGRINEDPVAGVAVNRNWPHRWTEFDPEAGVSPASEPETQALIRFAFAHPEIAAVWTLSLGDNLREAPKKPGSTIDDADLPLYAELSRLYNAAAGKVLSKPTSVPGSEGTTDGSIAEWAYHQLGVAGIASRPWAGPDIPDPAPAGKPAPPGEGEARWLWWNDHVVGGKAFVPFAPFDHPTLGRVEIGGWRPGVLVNPPFERAAALADAHTVFLKDLAARLPELTVRDATATAQGGGAYLVTATVANVGRMPTAPAQGVRTRKAPPVLVRVRGKGVRLLGGKPLERVDTLAPSGGKVEYRWMILAPEGTESIEVEATCPKAGRAVATVPLRR